MPFSIRKNDKKFQVVNSETGDVKGTFDNEDDAKKQLAALYVHVPDARKSLADTDIRTKAVSATIEDTSANPDEYPGTFVVELSNESLDRDGDTLKADEWETPLPEQITFVNDHTHKMASVVGSAKPELIDGKIICKGEWAETDNAQDTRKVIKHVPYVSVSYREKQDRKAGTVSRELVNGSFVVVPSNTKARVLASKALGDNIDPSTMTPQQRAQAIHDMALDLGADCGTMSDLVQADEVKSSGDTIAKALAAAGLHITIDTTDKSDSSVTVKHNDKVLGTHKFSQAPGSAPNGSDSQPADQAEEEAAALVKLKAAAWQITSKTRQFTHEGETQNA